MYDSFLDQANVHEPDVLEFILDGSLRANAGMKRLAKVPCRRS